VNLYVVFPRLLLDDAVDLVESLDGQFLEDGRRSRLGPSLDRRTAVVDADVLLVRRVARLDGDVRNVLGRKLLEHGRRQRYGLRPDLSRRKSQRTTHTHPFNGPFSGTTKVSRYQKGKTSLDFTEARDSEWQWHQLGHASLHLNSDR